MSSKRKLIAGIALLLLFVCSFGVELLWFQKGVLALPKEQRTLSEVSLAQLELTDLVFGEDGWFEITGENPGFRVHSEQYISKLMIGTNGQTQPMHVTVSNDDKVYDVHSGIKGMTVIRVNEQAADVFFGVSVDDGSSKFTIDSIAVDNTLTINRLRVCLMCSVCLIVWFFVYFYRVAVNRLHISFLVLALTIGINLALATPAWYGMDEGAHYIRAYQFANFNLGFHHEEKIPWINEIEDFFFYTGGVNSPHNTYEERRAFIQSYSTKEYGLEEYFPTTAATYPFVPYFFAGLGILLARLLGMPFVYTFYAGRIFNVLGYAMICFFAIRTAKMGKRLLFLMSLLPYALFSAGVYTADTLTVSFAILAMALYLNMLTADDGTLDHKLPIGFGLCCAAMAMCKLPYAPLCILVLTVPVQKFRSAKHAVKNFVLVFGVVGVISVATLLFGADKGIIQWYQPGMSIVGQIKFILTHPFQYAWIMLTHVLENWTDYLFGSTWEMGYCENISSIWVMLTVTVLGVVALFDWEPENEAVALLPKLACVAAVLCSWALVMTALYVSYNVVGAPSVVGVQGRYFYPLLLPLLLLLKNTKLGAGMNKMYLNAACFVFAAGMGIVAAVHVFAGFCM